MRGELTLKFNGQEVRVFQEANMWLFDTQEGEPCETFSTSLYTLEEAIEAYELYVTVTEVVEQAADFIKRQLNQ